jgi:serine/threonine protein kinase
MINAAIQITYAFRELHRKGLSYQDLNDGNFFFNPATGDVLICDNDNVCPPSTSLGIKGKCRYMAPEIVIGNSNPNNLSDYFSLSVVLFMLFFNNHPFDGKRVAEVPCLDDAIEQNVYGRNPIFIYDPEKADNRPVRGIHTNVINRWPLFPEFFRQAFVEAFAEDALHNPNKRKSDNDWIRILTQLRSQTVSHSCGNETFVDLDKTFTLCFNCQKSIERPLMLTIGKQRTALYPKMKIYANQTTTSDDIFTVTGEVAVNRNNPNIWGLMNRTSDTWKAVYPNGKELEVRPDTGLPIYKNVVIWFSAQIKGDIQ